MVKKINTLVKNLIPAEHEWKIGLFKQWNTIIGTMKDKVHIEKINGNLLVLGVSHPSWAQELRLLSPFLKQKINALFPCEKIKNITFRTVSYNTIKKNPVAIPMTTIQTINEPKLGIKEKKCLQKIGDIMFVNYLTQYYIRCMKKIK